MRFQPLLLALTSPLLVSLTSAVGASARYPGSSDLLVTSRDEHAHHHAAPLLELNETEVTMHHQPTPPSYYTLDWEYSDPAQASDRRSPALIITHSIFMALAFFVFLPMGETICIMLRSVKHPMHGVAVIAFYGSFFLACEASSAYKKFTPDMYPNASHARHGYYVLLLALMLTSIDIPNIIRRIFVSLKGSARAVLGSHQHSNQGPEPDSEYVGLIGGADGLDSVDGAKITHHAYHDLDNEDSDQELESTELENHVRLNSVFSSSAPLGPTAARLIPILRRIAGAVYSIAERILFFAGFALLLSGVVVYTGGCRQNYINGCLAHLIKGSIFWCYGLVSFARFLGWNAAIGWAWNRTPAPASGYPTAEFVESTVIFLYGVTNTWMERWGANPGDPFTTKQIQHISIAVMFWFGGLLGMAMESRTLRKWLSGPSQDVEESAATYTASFNPFPALVVGVTGAVMAAHFQVYLFQVQIHQLWGNLLVAFAILRCLTYFFMWVAPPRLSAQLEVSSRPPTEALGSFLLTTCGGLCFVFSAEEITIAAMRRGRDDIMMFAVVAVAITCLACCWVLCVVGFNGWLRMRAKRGGSCDSAARPF
ncbi:hypothetical protein MVEN_00949800 [Mycena venus]|uniref:Cytoplasmic protein n=1 Tax=Mycena venus TaxID=2733690 RepID=A0A8H7CZQ1_9AGAR|nr:hypothetical protein MVEN_00949800 [Mycena venus]